VKGLSENIRVRSIVGRFLEHSRIFHFANGGNDEIYLGSADWMPRNLFERCEVVFPVRDPAAMARIHDEILPAYMADTVKARIQQSDGNYVRASKLLKDAPPFSEQIFLMQLAEGKTDLDAIPLLGADSGLNFQWRAASSDLPAKYLLGPVDWSVAPVTLPSAPTVNWTDTLRVPLMVFIALGTMSGRIWFTIAGFMVVAVGAAVCSA
jgi:hypothetical protein